MTRHPIACSVLALLGLAACATPGIDYEARLMPPNVEVAATRVVAVDRFDGPAGDWYANQFEAMLYHTVFDGAPWFQLVDYHRSADGPEKAGTYTGVIDITKYSTSERINTVSKCTEWDGLFDCETREDVDELCIEERVDVRVEPRLVDAATGRVILIGSYPGEASTETCHELGLARDRDRHHWGRDHGLFGGFGALPPPDLLYAALSDTLDPIRRDIAPRNATVRATFIAEAYDPVVRADPRFEQAVKLGERDPAAACETWSAMATAYPEAPAVIHNMAACAEASGDYAAAQALYAEAATLSVKYAGDGASPAKDFLRALNRMSDRRYGEQVLDSLTRPQDPPADTQPDEAAAGS